MKHFIIILSLLFSLSYAHSQDAGVRQLKADAMKIIKKDDKDTTKKLWKTGGSFASNANQGSLTNWSAGGEKFSFSLNSYLNYYLFYKKDRHHWDNNIDLQYGVVKTTSLGMRKASDRIDFLSKYGYELQPKLSLTTLLNFRSQFDNGYAYSKTAEGKDSATLTSRGLQPAYILLSEGLDYTPTKSLSIYLSPITARFIVVTDDILKPIYSVPLDKNSRNEFGAFASINYLKTFSKNLTFKSKLDLFSNYKSNPQNVDIFWSNALTAKITKYINFSLNADLIYDDDTKNTKPGKGPAPQIQQLMGIGFAYSFKSY